MSDKLKRPVLISFDERKGTVETSEGTFDYYTLRAEYDLDSMDVIRLCEVEGFDSFKYLVFTTDTNNEVYSGTAEFYTRYEDACRKYVGLISTSL